MGDEPCDTETDRAIADWSSLPANPTPTALHHVRSERPLHGIRHSVWLPIIIGVVIWQWTGPVFGPIEAKSRGDWTWILGFYMTAYSVLPAQICLLNLGLLFGPGRVRQRAIVYWLVSIALLANWYAWLAWARWIRNETPLIDRDFAAMGVWLPLYVFTLQIPSLVLLFWNWQFVNSKVDVAADPPRGSQRFSILDLMIATAVVAVSLVCYRWLLNAGGGLPHQVELPNWIAMWWRTLGIGVAIVPMTLAWLAIRHFNYVVGWCATVIYLLLAVTAGCLIQDYLDELVTGGGWLEIIAGMTVGFALPMIVGLHLLRGFGWRLVRRGSNRI